MLKLSDKNKGIFFILCAAFFFSLMSVFVRLSGDLPVMQKALFRNLVAAFVSGFLLLKNKESMEVPKNARLDLFMRAFLGSLGLVANFYAIGHLNLSDANMLNKLSPFFATLASIYLLKEKASRKDWGTLIFAFIGALLVMKPGSNMDPVPAFVGFAGGVLAGFAYTYLRRLGTKGVKGQMIIFCFSVFSTLMVLPFIWMHHEPMSAKQLIILLLAGCAATGGQFCITKAYTYAPAKEISVFDYTQILFAAIWGFFLFDQVPDILSVLGYIIVIGAAIVRFLANRSKE